MTHPYRNAAAFKQALEQRLRTSSKSGTDFARRRQLVIFDRFLARVAHAFGEAVTLKGGLALELRLDRARTTIDVDLRMMGPPDGLLDRLRAAAMRDLGDFMVFTVRRDDRHPDIQNDGLQYDGQRFRVECTVAGKVYGRPFGVDVAFGDPVLGEPDVRIADDTLAFAGIAPPAIRVYPIETHIAEKLHAYTMPRTRPNTRVKDLADLALLASAGPLEAQQIRAALEQTFAFRQTHPLPERLPPPPENWAAPYSAIALEDELRWRSLPELFEAVGAFLNPVLSGPSDAQWEPQGWQWRSD